MTLEERIKKVFTDRIDQYIWEYGILRNPKTGTTVFFDAEKEEGVNCSVNIQNISFEEVKEEVKEMSKGFFDFIGSSLEEELKTIDKDNLSNYIYSINCYSGNFFSGFTRKMNKTEWRELLREEKIKEKENKK